MSLPTQASQSVAAVAAKLGVELDPSQVAALCAYIELMMRWNRTYNLTAVRDPQQMLVQHLYDSLSVVPRLAAYAASRAEGTSLSILDVGSGGGLPGVVLAIVRPDWKVVCVDAVEKKTAFVRQVAASLKLPNLSAQHARIESLPSLQNDLVISRAFASLLDFTNWSGFHVKQNGVMVAMKGKTPQDEIDALHVQGDWNVRKMEPLVVPELDGQRCLLWMSRSDKEVF